MCLIIFSPDIRKALIRKSVLMRGFDGNPDGCGFSYIEDGKIKLEKGYFSFKGFYKKYLEVTSRVKNGPMLIHFRASTRGLHTKTNCQPIYVNKELVMAHNGTFHDLELFNERFSDSVTMAKHLGQMKMSLPLNRAYLEILNILCMGVVNKLVFFDAHGNWEIINSQLGMWRNGCWYSDKGECLKRENYSGYYASKGWKKAQNLIPNRGEAPKKKVSKIKTGTWVYSPQGVSKFKVKQTTAPLKANPFGAPSKMFRPQVFEHAGMETEFSLTD